MRKAFENGKLLISLHYSGILKELKLAININRLSRAISLAYKLEYDVNSKKIKSLLSHVESVLHNTDGSGEILSHGADRSRVFY